MESKYSHYVELQSSILKLNPSANDCRLTIIEVRRQMDEACDQGKITIAQWRTLLEQISAIQSSSISADSPVKGGKGGTGGIRSAV